MEGESARWPKRQMGGINTEIQVKKQKNKEYVSRIIIKTYRNELCDKLLSHELQPVYASISNLRYADDTALCGKSPQEINNIVHKVNDAGRKRLLKLNAQKTKLMVLVGDENTNVSIDVDGETIDKVNSFKYLGAIKTSMGSCSEDVKARIGRAKKATMELDTIWKDRGIRKELKMKLVKALIWPVIRAYLRSRRMDFKER